MKTDNKKEVLEKQLGRRCAQGGPRWNGVKPFGSAAATVAHGAWNHPTRLPSHQATVRNTAVLQSKTKEGRKRKRLEETRRRDTKQDCKEETRREAKT